MLSPSFAPSRQWIARLAAILFALLLTPMAAASDERAAFVESMAQASAQYRVAMQTLETDGREQTAAEVRMFRELVGEIIERFGKSPAFAKDEAFAAALLDIDVRLVATLIVIDIGSRDAAREALKAIGDTLAQLHGRSAPPQP
jgi:hypothetical protein